MDTNPHSKVTQKVYLVTVPGRAMVPANPQDRVVGVRLTRASAEELASRYGIRAVIQRFIATK